MSARRRNDSGIRRTQRIAQHAVTQNEVHVGDAEGAQVAARLFMQTAQALTLTGMNQEEFQRGEKQRRDDFGTFLKSLGGVGQFLLTMFGGGGAAPAK